ncbi:uncharacterized protein B0P05DRAFT_539716 [Gilbertella persicaria]|uniref:uncharacterized protein n=1 Tax=Gilbertella persicaria TaxID=101096 RepID=UPI0022205CCC|nr:uncharacterized protein B0P05DRAFT_539716 [Gilbertella persicaria]KAI8080820.1 hypothetical protein B0P05DRAFT_539716 [Gilbertella persicaria]
MAYTTPPPPTTTAPDTPSITYPPSSVSNPVTSDAPPSSSVVPTTSYEPSPETTYYYPTSSTLNPTSSFSSTASASTSSTAPTSLSSASQKTNSNTSVIIGCVVGIVGGLALIGLLVFLFICCRRRRRNRARQTNQDFKTTNDMDSVGKDVNPSYGYNEDYNAYSTAPPPTQSQSTHQPGLDNNDPLSPRPFVPAYDPTAVYPRQTRYEEILPSTSDGQPYYRPYPGDYYLSDSYHGSNAPASTVYTGGSHERNVPNEIDHPISHSHSRHVPNEL